MEQPTITRKEWLENAARQLQQAGIDSAHLDSELLLTHALGIPRTALHAHPEETIPPVLIVILDAMLSLRVIRVPLAYIVGHREFYGRLFKVTPSVLIPRPETEDIVTLMKELSAPATIIDVGTGSGALAVTLALEFPAAHVYATDISARALTVARQNAVAYEAPIEFIQSDLLTSLAPTTYQSPTTIVANLPYVADSDPRSPETAHEPAEALFAPNDGLQLIDALIGQAAVLLQPNDYLLLESNPSQQPSIALAAQANGFAVEQTRRLISVLKRI